MSLDVWAALVATLLILMLSPGPSHLLMLSNSLTHGFRPSLATALGDLTANTLQMLAAGLGVAAVLQAMPRTFIAMQIVGVFYLLFLGVRQLAPRNPPNTSAETAKQSGRSLFAQGFLNSSLNPRVIIFFAALFPQFISAGERLAPQLTILMVTFLTIDALFLTAYGIAAEKLRSRFAGGMRKLQLLGAGALIVAALLLAAKLAVSFGN